MNNKKEISIVIKSNVTLKSRGAIPPIDNMPKEYFDVRLDSALTEKQRVMKSKMLFWADNIYDANNNPVEDVCYKGCLNCGEKHNHCKRPQNENRRV